MTKNKMAGRFYLSFPMIAPICGTVFCTIVLPYKKKYMAVPARKGRRS